MIISKEKYCIASKSYPIKFYMDGVEYDDVEDVLLTDKEYYEDELKTYDEPENFQIIKVMGTYEL